MENKASKKSVFESPLLSTKIKSANVTLLPEAGLGYLVGPILALMSNGVINIWLVQYWDKVLMLGKWAPLFQTLLPILSAVLIIIGNLFVGKLMERKPSIAGKARPLILIAMPFIAVALLALFIVPLPEGAGGTFSNIGASIIIAVAYNLYYALAWPIYYTSHSALVNLSTRNGASRGLLSTAVMGAQLGAAGLSGMAGGLLVDLIGLLPKYQYGIDPKTGEALTTNVLSTAQDLAKETGYEVQTLITPAQANSKWTILMIVMIVCLVIGCLLEYYFTRERITEENVKLAAGKSEGNAEDVTKIKKASMGEQIKICIHDKYWWLIIVFFFLYQFGGQMKNNDMSFYSQAMTGETSLSSLINTLGAIPTALGMALVWPIAAKLTKAKTISLGGVLAFLGALIAFICLIPDVSSSTAAISALSVTSFMIKALGTAPAMYISLALMANILDHQEAVYGKRTDGFTMSVYGSIMIAMSGVCNGIIVGINAITPTASQKFVHTFLAFGVEGICYLIMALMFLFMNVERYTKIDNRTIIEDQKAACLAEGREWIEPEERAKQEEAENARLVEAARVDQLKIDCQKKGLDFDTENKKFLEQKKIKDEQAAAKKAANEEKKKAAAAAKQAKFDALPEAEKQKILSQRKEKEAAIESEFALMRQKAKNSGLAA